MTRREGKRGGKAPGGKEEEKAATFIGEKKKQMW
jgi:hypothetical protein